MEAISFKKLLQASLFPASTLLLTKVMAFWIMVMSLNATWTFNYDDTSFPGIYPIVSNTSLIGFTSFSDVIFLFLISLFLFYYVIVALFLHNTHLHPRLMSKLVKYNLLFLVKNNFSLYHEILIWLIFAWIANILVLLNSFAGKTFIGIPTFSILFTAFLTMVFIKDATLELTRKKNER